MQLYEFMTEPVRSVICYFISRIMRKKIHHNHLFLCAFAQPVFSSLLRSFQFHFFGRFYVIFKKAGVLFSQKIVCFLRARADFSQNSPFS